MTEEEQVNGNCSLAAAPARVEEWADWVSAPGVRERAAQQYSGQRLLDELHDHLKTYENDGAIVQRLEELATTMYDVAHRYGLRLRRTPESERDMDLFSR